MKKILLGLFLSTFLFACNNQKEEAAATPDAVTTTDAPKTGDEILAMSEGDEAKNSLMAFSKGDVNGLTNRILHYHHTKRSCYLHHLLKMQVKNF